MPDDHIARLTQIESTRYLTQSVGRMEKAVISLTAEVSRLSTQVALQQQQDEKIDELKITTSIHAKAITALEIKNASLESASSGLKSVREWMPSLVMLIVAIVMLTKQGVLHL